MKKYRLRDAYGEMPEELKKDILQTLKELSYPKRRVSARMPLVAAIIIVCLTGSAFAISDIVHRFKTRRDALPQVNDYVSDLSELPTGESKWFKYQMVESLVDNKSLLIKMEATPKDPDKYVIIDPALWSGESEALQPIAATVNGHAMVNNIRTFCEYVVTEIKDNTLYMEIQIPITDAMEQSEHLAVILTLFDYKVDGNGVYPFSEKYEAGEVDTVKLEYDIPIFKQPTSEKQNDAANKIDIVTIDSVRITGTAASTRVEIQTTIDADAAPEEISRLGWFSIEIEDADGQISSMKTFYTHQRERIKSSAPEHDTGKVLPGDVHLTTITFAPLERLPDRVYVYLSYDNQDLSDPVAVDVSGA